MAIHTLASSSKPITEKERTQYVAIDILASFILVEQLFSKYLNSIFYFSMFHQVESLITVTLARLARLPKPRNRVHTPLLPGAGASGSNSSVSTPWTKLSSSVLSMLTVPSSSFPTGQTYATAASTSATSYDDPLCDIIK